MAKIEQCEPKKIFTETYRAHRFLAYLLSPTWTTLGVKAFRVMADATSSLKCMILFGEFPFVSLFFLVSGAVSGIARELEVALGEQFLDNWIKNGGLPGLLVGTVSESFTRMCVQ